MSELDARKSLGQLQREWEGCTKCKLGEHRNNVGGKMVFGEGVRRGIMLIGEGPGETEEGMGMPFCGRSGKVLRKVLTALGADDIVYITNAVPCRSCVPALDRDGQPKFRRQFGRNPGPALPMWQDMPPNKQALEACKSRFYEEIYLVDPIIIVSLGNSAAELLLKRSIAITNARGKTERVGIPGVTYEAVVTE